MCWYCYWGWPKPVADVYDEALAALDGDESPLKFGPAHVVWSDENFWDSIVKSCLEESTPEFCDRYDLSASDMGIVADSLRKLLEVPETIRCPAGAGLADDDDVENCPPPEGMVMVKR